MKFQVAALAERSRRARRIEDRLLAIARQRFDPQPIPGCRGCELAREAGPGWVLVHRMSEHRRTPRVA